MNSIILSIRPEWSAKILNGEKTEEIRKNLGKLKPPFKVYAYVTKDNKLQWVNGCLPIRWGQGYRNERLLEKTLNGKVCFEFVCDGVTKLEWDDKPDYMGEVDGSPCFNEEEICKNSCLDPVDLYEYAERKHGRDYAYSLHISELKVYDTPKELGEFNHYKKKTVYSGMDCPPYVDEVKVQLTKAPQSFMYVEELK